MKITKIRIENFRSFLDETIALDKYMCLVGPNGSGKSTILMALNVFFRNTVSSLDGTTLTKNDFHHGNTSEPIKITLTFEHLSEAAQEELKDYYRQGKLVVSAVAEWDESSEKAQVKQIGSRYVMAAFKIYFAKQKEGIKADDLKKEYKAIRDKYPDLPDVKSKGDMEEALLDYEKNHPDSCELAESKDEFYGFTKGSGRLAKYIQWVYIPAVKDASTEQDEAKKSALGQLLETTVRAKVDFSEYIRKLKEDVANKYEEIVNNEAEVLRGMSDILTTRLRAWSHSEAKVDLSWNYDKEKSISISPPFARALIGEDKFIGEIARLGHGMQRVFLVTLLQELANIENENAPNLILGFEEPELYQHPPQIRHMVNVLEKLTDKNAQVILTTHNPYFVPGKGFESVCMVKKGRISYKSAVSRVTKEQLDSILSDALGEVPKYTSARIAAIEQIMQPSLKELFFTPMPIMVEGIEDVAYILTYIELMKLSDEFRNHECQFIMTGGKTNMSRPLAITKAFNINSFIIFDGDTDETKEETANKKDNTCLLKLSGFNEVDPLSKSNTFEKCFTMWATNIRKEVISEIKNEEWEKAINKVKDENGWQGVGGKNCLLIAATLEELWNNNIKSTQLETTCNNIIKYAKDIKNDE